MANETEECDTYDVNITQSAEDDLNEIIMYIARNNLQTAIKIMEKLKAKIDTLDHFPYRGGSVPELLTRNIKEYTQITETPWKIIYKVDGEIVDVLAIIDSRRNFQDLLVRKLLK